MPDLNSATSEDYRDMKLTLEKDLQLEILYLHSDVSVLFNMVSEREQSQERGEPAPVTRREREVRESTLTQLRSIRQMMSCYFFYWISDEPEPKRFVPPDWTGLFTTQWVPGEPEPIPLRCDPPEEDWGG